MIIILFPKLIVDAGLQWIAAWNGCVRGADSGALHFDAKSRRS